MALWTIKVRIAAYAVRAMLRDTDGRAITWNQYRYTLYVEKHRVRTRANCTEWTGDEESERLVWWGNTKDDLEWERRRTIDEDERVHRQCRFDEDGQTEKEEDEETERERDYRYETRSKRKRETEDTRGKKEERSGADREREIRDKTRKKWGSRDRKDKDENTRKEDGGGGTTCL